MTEDAPGNRAHDFPGSVAYYVFILTRQADRKLSVILAKYDAN